MSTILIMGGDEDIASANAMVAANNLSDQIEVVRGSMEEMLLNRIEDDEAKYLDVVHSYKMVPTQQGKSKPTCKKHHEYTQRVESKSDGIINTWWECRFCDKKL